MKLTKCGELLKQFGNQNQKENAMSMDKPEQGKVYSLTGDGTKGAPCIANGNSWAESEVKNPEACPGCGCLPGEGLTDGCEDRDGCGYHRSIADGSGNDLDQ